MNWRIEKSTIRQRWQWFVISNEYYMNNSKVRYDQIRGLITALLGPVSIDDNNEGDGYLWTTGKLGFKFEREEDAHLIYEIVRRTVIPALI